MKDYIDIESSIDMMMEILRFIVSFFGPDFIASIIFGVLGVLAAFLSFKLGKKILDAEGYSGRDTFIGLIFLLYFSVMIGFAVAISKVVPDSNYYDEVLGMILFAHNTLVSIDLFFKAKSKKLNFLWSSITFLILIAIAIWISQANDGNFLRHASPLVLLMYSIGTYFLGKYIDE